MADSAWDSAWYDFYAPPVFSPPQPAPLPLPPLGGPWWLSPPIFPASAAAQPAPRAPQPVAPAPPPGMANGLVRATATGVPVVGGLLNRMDAATNAALAPLLNPLFDPKDQLTEPSFGGRYAHSLSDQEIADQRFAADHPVLDTTANLAGGVASMAPVVPAVPWAFGVGKAVPTLAARSGLTGAGLGGTDGAVRGQDIPQGATVGGVLGAVLPAAGRVVGTLFRSSTRAPAVVDSIAADTTNGTANGVAADAKFAQRTYNPKFSPDGKFGGMTVDDVAAKLRSGAIKPADVPINYVVRNGQTMILNTRSAQALEAACVSRSLWHGVDQSGNQLFEDLLTGQLSRNRGAPFDTVRRTGTRS